MQEKDPKEVSVLLLVLIVGYPPVVLALVLSLICAPLVPKRSVSLIDRKWSGD